MRERKNGAPVLCMQGSYQADKPFFAGSKTFFVVTIFPALNSEIVRNKHKNWTSFRTMEAVAADRVSHYL
jgi:hypothetical protein